MAVTAGLALAGLGLAIYGEVKKSQAEKRAKQNLANRPKYSALPEDDSELNLATQQANQGMGANARQQLQNNTDRNLSTSANAVLMGGGDANAIGSLADRTQNAYNNSAIYDDQARQQHLNTLLGTMSRYNAQRQGTADKQFQVNQYAPWADRQQLYAQQIAGGQQTMNSGINIFAKGASGLAYSGGGGGGRRDYSGYDRSLPNDGVGSNTQGAWNHPDWGDPAVQGQEYGRGTMDIPAASGGSQYAWGGAPEPVSSNSVNANNNFTTWGNGSPQYTMTPYYVGSGV